MTKSTRNANTRWSSADEKELEKLARGNTPTGVIGLKLGRTKDSIQSKAQELDVSLHPTNQSPYNRRKK
jgi:LPS sulfotransferase NodH